VLLLVVVLVLVLVLDLLGFCASFLARNELLASPFLRGSCGLASVQAAVLTKSFLDQGSNGIDVSRRDFADARVVVQSGNEIVLG
jgi:hypothetical protein